MPVRKRNSPARSERLNFRASEAEEKLIRLGAKKRGEKVTQFIVRSACAEAEAVLADQRHFELSAKQHAAFFAALDRPARVIPSLKNLFTGPSILER